MAIRTGQRLGVLLAVTGLGLALGAMHEARAASHATKAGSGSAAGAGSGAATPAPVTVGGAPMFATKNIIQNAVNSKDHTTLVAAVKAAGLVETLSGPGPFTVFAPTNAAFAALPKGTVETLLKPENKAQLTKILTSHVVAANALSSAVKKMVKEGGGKHTVKTVSGATLTLKADGGKVTVTDETGGTARVTIADVRQSNGVIHVVDKVLLPK
jgi:uncharacterized surface protein with fasciclin (FAS1) repeats